MAPIDIHPQIKKRLDKRQRAWRSFRDTLKVFIRVTLYAAGLTVAFYLVALALFLLAPSVGKADEATDSTASQPAQMPVYDAALGGGSGILPTGLSEDDASYVSISRLESGDASYDDSLVSFRGEVVGEPVNSSSSSHKWVLVQSSGARTSSIEVLMTNEQVAQIKNWGSYQVKGATVRVTGIYRVADANNTGTLDVTAYVVRVVDEGGPLEPELVNTHVVVAGASLVALGGILTGVNVYQRRRSRS